MRDIRLLSNKVKKTPSSEVDADRYDFINLENTEPDFGIPPLDDNIMASDVDGTRKWLNPSLGLSIDVSGNLTVEENTVSIDTFGFTHTNSDNLHDVLADLDNSIGFVNYVYLVDDYTASPADALILDTSGGSFTVTLPASPSLGVSVKFLDAYSLTINPITLLRNGSTIEDIADDFILDVGGGVIDLVYDGTTWQIFVNKGPRGYTGSRGDTGFTGSIGFTGSQGVQGDPGTSVIIVGSVATVGDLPSPYGGNIGDGYIVQATGDLHVWDGSQWNNVGRIIGYTGSKGDIGFTGSTGFTGSRGLQGFTGSTGFTGSKGDTGFTGSTGLIGPIGYTGSRGYTGSQGIIGYTGSIGQVGTLTAGTGLTGGGSMDVDRTISLDTSYTDDRYVNTSGDTMTGNLTVTGTTTVLSTLDFEASDGDTITATMQTSDTLSFDGDAGQLFSITDSLSGTIFSVNDSFGIPSIELDDDGTIRLAQFVGNILVGTSVDDATNKLQVTGDIKASGDVTATAFNNTSDQKLKKNIKTLNDGMTIIDKINPVEFTWIATKKTGYGIIAQEIEKVLPEIVKTEVSGTKSVSYTQLIPFLVKAIQEQNKKISQLEYTMNNKDL